MKMEDRDTMAEMVNAMTVSDAEAFNPIYLHSPMLAKLMLDKFKHFLDNDFFTQLERQTILIRFLDSHDGVELIKEVLQFAKTCEHKEDYSAIILEWEYANSEEIIQANLSRVDGEYFGMTKQQLRMLKRQIPIIQTQVLKINADDVPKSIQQITQQILDAFKQAKENDKPDEDGGDTHA